MNEQIGHNYEDDLSESKIDFFITQQRFIGFIDLSNEHAHNYYEFFYTKSGNRLLYTNHIPFKLNSNLFVLLPPRQFHRTISVDNNNQELIFGGFKADFFDNLIPGKTTSELLENYPLTGNIKTDCKDYLQFTLGLLNDIFLSPESDTKTAQFKSALFNFLFNCIQYDKSDSNSLYTGENKLNIKIRYLQMADYIKKNFEKQITLDKLENEFNMSKYEISRNFKKYMGTSFIDYLNTIRVEQAKSLITNCDKNLTDIAFSVGFESLTHFERTFKKITKLNPSQFSSIYRNK